MQEMRVYVGRVTGAIRMFGGIWCTACMVQMAVIFLAGWSNGDVLLLTFNANNEKWIEVILVPAGTACTILLCLEGLYSVCQRWYAGIEGGKSCLRVHQR
jgi:hypothetical protein